MLRGEALGFGSLCAGLRIEKPAQRPMMQSTAPINMLALCKWHCIGCSRWMRKD